MKVSNWNKRTPKFWRKVGNVAVYSLPLLTATIMGSPMSSDLRQWIVFSLSIVLVGAKGLTKFTASEEVNEG